MGLNNDFKNLYTIRALGDTTKAVCYHKEGYLALEPLDQAEPNFHFRFSIQPAGFFSIYNPGSEKFVSISNITAAGQRIGLQAYDPGNPLQRWYLSPSLPQYGAQIINADPPFSPPPYGPTSVAWSLPKDDAPTGTPVVADINYGIYNRMKWSIEAVRYE